MKYHFEFSFKGTDDWRRWTTSPYDSEIEANSYMNSVKKEYDKEDKFDCRVVAISDEEAEQTETRLSVLSFLESNRNNLPAILGQAPISLIDSLAIFLRIK